MGKNLKQKKSVSSSEEEDDAIYDSEDVSEEFDGSMEEAEEEMSS
jgi:hypothetical protein